MNRIKIYVFDLFYSRRSIFHFAVNGIIAVDVARFYLVFFVTRITRGKKIETVEILNC